MGFTTSRIIRKDVHRQTFYPSLDQVLETRNLLHEKLSIPVELVNLIIDHAEYWPSVETEYVPPESNGITIIGMDEDRSLLRTVPLCYDEEVCVRSTYYIL